MAPSFGCNSQFQDNNDFFGHLSFRPGIGLRLFAAMVTNKFQSSFRQRPESGLHQNRRRKSVSRNMKDAHLLTCNHKLGNEGGMFVDW